VAKASVEIVLQGNVRAEAEALQKAFLNSLGWKGVRKLEQFATVNAARALATYVRAKAPSDTGQLGKSVRGRRSRITRPGAIVGPVAGKKQSWYAWFAVKGTKPHTIPKVTAKNLFSDRTFIEHPGTRGSNFVIEAVEANIQVAKDAMAKTIVLLINDEAMRAKVLGLEIEYANGTATKFQSETALQQWNKPDFVGPLTPLQAEAKRRNQASDKVKAIASSARANRLRADAKVFGIKPNMSNLRAG
jgi:hypothetical protein